MYWRKTDHMGWPEALLQALWGKLWLHALERGKIFVPVHSGSYSSEQKNTFFFLSLYHNCTEQVHLELDALILISNQQDRDFF